MGVARIYRRGEVCPYLPPLPFLPLLSPPSLSHFIDVYTIVDLVIGGTRKFFHDCNNCILRMRTLFFSITYVQYAHFIPEGDVRSLLVDPSNRLATI